MNKIVLSFFCSYQFSEQQATRPVQQVITVPAPAPSQPAAPQQYSGAQYYHNQQPVSPVIYSIKFHLFKGRMFQWIIKTRLYYYIKDVYSTGDVIPQKYH